MQIGVADCDSQWCDVCGIEEKLFLVMPSRARGHVEVYFFPFV